MISRSYFTRRADSVGVDAKTVERDYVLTHVLAGICLQQGSERMAFKGGTALRLCFFEDYRYSADLDFSLIDGMTIADASELVSNALIALEKSHAFPLLELNADASRVDYIGPLGRRRNVKLDLATDELVLNTEGVPLLSRYEDQPRVDVVAYTLDEVAAEKLRCVIQRVQARDLFDLHQLFVERGVDVDTVWLDFERKTRHKRIDPARFPEMYERRLPAWESRWDDEMEAHVPTELRPHFGAVKREVTRALRSHLG